MSFSMAATTFSGQNYGAGNMERVRKGMRVTVAMGVIYCICVGSILLLFAHPLIGRSDGYRIWCKSYAVLLPILFPAGHYAWTGRRHPRNRKICSANGHYPVLTLCLPRNLDPAAREKAAGYEVAVLIAQVRRSAYDTLEQELGFCQLQNIQIAGAIVTE